MDFDIRESKTVPIDLEDEMKKSFISYAMATIINRALPDVRDGLKPVHRRILYAMIELGLTPDKPFRKSVRIVGDVLGKYHPHGDTAVYDAMVRMAQDFSTRYMLVEGHGNFGSMDGDGAAAMRYTEARLAKISMELLRDIEKQTVDFVPNFDETQMQPSVLPARFPNLLVNGSGGIAVGMATNIPPHNLRETIDAAIAMIDDPEIGVHKLIEYLPGPDFPTGALIMGRNGISRAYRTGQGRVIMRAACDIEDMGSARSRIVVREMPYQVNKAKLVEKIAELVQEKKLEGVSDIRDESDRSGIRVVIELKRDVNANVVLNFLYKHTQLQETFGINMLALVDGRPKVMSLRQVLRHYIDHQKDVVTRRTVYDLEKARARAHILEGLIRALDLIDAIIEVIRSSQNVSEAKARLMTDERFADRENVVLVDGETGARGFTEPQAQAILDMRLQRLTGLERQKLIDELSGLIVTIGELEAILGDENLLMQVIRSELVEIAAKYGDDRRTKICADPSEIEDEDLIQEEDMVVTVTNMGYIKRLPADTYKAQRRGGVGISGLTTREEDVADTILTASTHDWLLFFTNRGRVHKLKCYQIPQAGRQARGTAVVNLLQLEPGEGVTTVIPLAEGLTGAGQYLMLVTRGGTVKKTPLEEFANLRAAGLRAINLEEGDELIAALLTDGECDVIIATRKGQAIRFHEKGIRSMHRATSGVRGIRLRPGDEVVSALLVDDSATALAVTERGCGKRVEFADFPRKLRGGMGVRALKITGKTGNLVSLVPVYELNDVLLISSDGTVIRIAAASVSVLSRAAQGVRVMRLREGDSLVGVEVAERSEDEEVERSELPEDEGEFDNAESAEGEEEEADDGEESEEEEPEEE
jgi:DNA gyrase subunit A